MTMKRLAKWGLIGLILSFSAACAQDVGDIDRTQPNKVKKSKLEGTWYMRHTIVDVPPSVQTVFVGIASSMEKVRWEIQEDYLLAYRAYEKTPGYDKKAGGFNQDGEQTFKEGYEDESRDGEYHEEPIAAYPIEKHFDVQRQYNTSTGEPSNVIVENSSDREWHEREYMRVDWSTNLVDFSLPFQLKANDNQAFYVQGNQGGSDAFYTEHRDVNPKKDGEELAYFDFTVKTESGSCFDSAEGACATGQNELEIRSSFKRI